MSLAHGNAAKGVLRNRQNSGGYLVFDKQQQTTTHSARRWCLGFSTVLTNARLHADGSGIIVYLEHGSWGDQKGNYDAAGITAIADTLHVNGALTSFDLADNQIGDEGAKAIGEALRVNGALTSLDLGGE